MHHLLFITSSLFGEASKSRLIGAEFVEAWRRAHPRATVVERVLSADTMPHLTQETLAAAATPAASRTPAQQAAAALADKLIEEVEAADVIVIAAPMYNFTISTTLKAWVDHIARAGRTFRYTAHGPEGLLHGKTVFVMTARGGFYNADSPAAALDFQEPYLRAILGFVGMTNVTFVHAEGLAIDPETATRGLHAARQALVNLVPAAQAA
ncbi:MAG TPA: FMN-dependent NADH-azoreductase [Acetobacteraceae bacterium]|nr:FMN-dependent NADH-azoreductase [Acetobacteraceae bacterium]